MKARFSKAFTLVEVLVASAVIATISAGVLVTTWKMVSFARLEAERMMADAVCHDIMWAVYSQKYSDIKSISSFTVNYKKTPKLYAKNVLGTYVTTYPLRRGSTKPKCTVTVKETIGEADADGNARSNKVITVALKWYDANDKLVTWEDANGNVVKTGHKLTVTRSAMERGSGDASGEVSK